MYTKVFMKREGYKEVLSFLISNSSQLHSLQVRERLTPPRGNVMVLK